MDGLLNQEEIDKLLNQLSHEAKMPSITEIKPSEINKIDNTVERNKIQSQFKYVNALYIEPLRKLLLAYCKMKKIAPINPNINDLSIIERINIFQLRLLPLGFTSDQLLELVPKDTEEVNLLVSAMEKGFKEETTINNKERLIEARNYLSSLEKEENHSIETPRRKF